MFSGWMFDIQYKIRTTSYNHGHQLWIYFYVSLRNTIVLHNSVSVPLRSSLIIIFVVDAEVNNFRRAATSLDLINFYFDGNYNGFHKLRLVLNSIPSPSCITWAIYFLHEYLWSFLCFLWHKKLYSYTK